MDESLLFRLPPELRNMIYELAVSPAKPIYIKLEDDMTLSATHGITLPMRGFGLTRACKQLRSEFLRIFYTTVPIAVYSDIYSYQRYYWYSSNEFFKVIISNELDRQVSELEHWLYLVDDQASYFHNVTIELGVWNPSCGGIEATVAASIATRFRDVLKSAAVSSTVAFQAEYLGFDGDEDYIQFKIPMQTIAEARSYVTGTVEQAMRRLLKRKDHEDYQSVQANVRDVEEIVNDFVNLLSW